MVWSSCACHGGLPELNTTTTPRSGLLRTSLHDLERWLESWLRKFILSLSQ